MKEVSIVIPALIESIFGTVRFSEHNARHHLTSKMSQRWLAAVLLYAEEGFRTVKGFKQIPEVIGTGI